jgi:hypothetical protein
MIALIGLLRLIALTTFGRGCIDGWKGIETESQADRIPQTHRGSGGDFSPKLDVPSATSTGLRAWAVNCAMLGGLLAIAVAAFMPHPDPYFVKAMVLVPTYAVAGLLIGAIAYGVVRALKRTVKVAKGAAPIAATAALSAGRAGADAIRSTKQSALEKKLAELDRLHVEGKISDEEKTAARAAALSK